MRHIGCVMLALASMSVCSAEDKTPAPDPLTVRMETERISFEFKNAELNGIVEWLTTETKLEIAVSEAAQQYARENKLKITARLSDVKLSAALRLLFETNGLVMSLEKGIVRLRVRDEDEDKRVNRRIDVRELIAPVEDYEAPDIALPDRDPAEWFG